MIVVTVILNNEGDIIGVSRLSPDAYALTQDYSINYGDRGGEFHRNGYRKGGFIITHMVD